MTVALAFLAGLGIGIAIGVLAWSLLLIGADKT